MIFSCTLAAYRTGKHLDPSPAEFLEHATRHGA